MTFTIQLVILIVCIPGTFAPFRLCDQYPSSVMHCIKEASKHPVNMRSAEKACLTEYYINDRADNNLTASDEEFFKMRSVSRFGLGPPPTGFRVRKEIRVLTDEERNRLFSAMEVLYKTGVMARFGRLHAVAGPRIHHGAAFLPWHRVFITDFEEELRRVDPTVSLPYWDYTMDWNMTSPWESIIWSPCFLGNGNGTITTGRFSGWHGGRHGPIQRDYARPGAVDCTSRLLTKRDIRRILSYCYFKNITTGQHTGYRVSNNLEWLHDGPHDWIGGDMGEVGWAAYDPIFWFHHAMIDHIWEMFRRKQVQSCNVNPEMDYRHDRSSSRRGQPGHKAMDRMKGYWHLFNKDGLRNSWTTHFYNYEPLPSCPHCGGSKYLECNHHVDPFAYPHGLCTSKRRRDCPSAHHPRYKVKGAFAAGEVIFDGEEMSTFTTFPEIQRFKGPHGDGRNRDMSIESARNRLIQAADLVQLDPMRRPSPVLPVSPVARSSRTAVGLGDRQEYITTIPNQLLDCRVYSGLPFNPGFVPFGAIGLGGPMHFYRSPCMV